jgi:hypothetical protein
MKTSIIGLGLLAILLQASPAAAKVYRQNVITYAVSPDAEVTDDKFEYSNPDCDEDLDCRTTQTCRREGTVPTLTRDKRHFACCHVGQNLLGSPALRSTAAPMVMISLAPPRRIPLLPHWLRL